MTPQKSQNFWGVFLYERVKNVIHRQNIVLGTKYSVLATMTDNEIIQYVLHRDSALFRLLVEKYQPMVFRTCMGFLHHKEDAEDLTQEVFVQAFQSLATFKAESSFLTWLYRITVNASLNHLRKSAKWGFLQRMESKFESMEGSSADNPETMLLQDEQRKWVNAALDSLPEKQRTAIVLSKYDDLSQKEIAAVMNTSEGAVEALLQRAKASLKAKLQSKLKKMHL